MRWNYARAASAFFFLFGILPSTLQGQPDSLKQNFFPHHLNDKWVYDVQDFGIVDTLEVIIISDSSDSQGSAHLQYALSTRNPLNPPSSYWHEHQKVDSIGNVFWGNGETYPYLQFKANAALSERWATGFDVDTAFFKALTDTLELGIPTKEKHIEHRMGTEGYGEWYADGMGMVTHIGDYAMPGRLHLIAGRIGGKTIGDTTLVVNSLSTAPSAPAVYQLFQNYPNPFNPSTKIGYTLPRRMSVSLAVYNALGQKVAQLAQGQVQAGYHETIFDGIALPSGVYFYRLVADQYMQVRKLVLLR